MQKEFKGFLKILKGYRNIQRFILKMSKNNLNDFRSNSEFFKIFFKNFENASEREIEFKNLSEDFNKDQFKTE